MRNFNYREIVKSVINSETIELINRIYEFRGKHNYLIKTYPEAIKGYMDIARIHNCMIGTHGYEPRTIIDFMHGKEYSDEYSKGFWKDLSTILNSKDELVINEDFIYSFVSKEIPEISSWFYWYKSDEARIVKLRFRDEDTYNETIYEYEAVRKPQVEEYSKVISQELAVALFKENINPLLVVALLTLDLYFINPNNERETFLIVYKILLSYGFESIRYASLSRIFKETYSDFIKAFKESSSDWTEGNNNYLPFVKYMLNLIIKLYEEVDAKITPLCAGAKINKSDRLRHSILTFGRDFCKSEIRVLCSDISMPSIENALSKLSEEGKIDVSGVGRGAKYSLNIKISNFTTIG